MFSDSAELLFLSERFSQIEDGELRTENIKRRIDLMWKFVKPRPTPAKVVTASEKMQNEIKPIPQPEEKQQFSFCLLYTSDAADD